MATVKELHVNGSRRALDADAERSLLSVLRDDLDLTGSKYGCGEGRCGACTVLLDGQPVRSCTTRVGTAEGKPIQTIEGLAKDGKLHPLQEAFLEADALQCGYCTSGMIMSAVGASEPRSAAEPRGHRAIHERQHLPLRHLSADRRRHPAGGPGDERRRPMNEPLFDDLLLEPERYELFTDTILASELDRRAFFRIVGGGLVVGLHAGRGGRAATGRPAQGRSARRDQENSVPGCTSARTARSPSTPARSRLARTSARR